MTSFIRFSQLGLFCIVLAGCAVGNSSNDADERIPSESQFGTTGGLPAQGARTVEDFDTTTKAEKKMAATVASGNGKILGETIASLGNPAKPGFWLETPLVSETTDGRIEYAANGKSISVQLIPIAGESAGGSRISLPAVRLLKAPLSGLIALNVFSE